MRAQLVIENFPLQPKYAIFPGQFLILGRGQNADVVLDNDNIVSRLHCKFFYREGKYWLEDLGSRNHSYVNRKRILRKVLRNGDLIQIGSYKIRFYLIDDIDDAGKVGQDDIFLLKRSDKLTARIVVKLGLLTREQVKRALKKQEQLAIEGPYYPLEEILLQEDYLNADQVKSIHNYRHQVTLQIPNYIIAELIGMGGMGSIYRARSTKSNNWVAIKIFDVQYQKLQAQLEQQFRREAQVMLQLHSPHIVKGLEFGETQKHIYIVMEYVDGISLQEEIREQGGRLLANRALEIIIQVAKALDHAHEKGLVHRDIKPENILLTGDKVVKLCDFGLVKHTGLQENSENPVLGTVAYMSPEQIRAQENIDIRSDIYSLGAVFYRMVFGKIPFSGDNRQIRQQHLLQPLVFPNDGQHFQKMELARIIRKMMSKGVNERYQNPAELYKELEVFYNRSLERDFMGTEESPTAALQETHKISPGAKFKNYRLLWKAIVILALGTLILLGLWWRNPPQNPQAYNKIVQTLEKQNYEEAERLSRIFLHNYPQHKLTEKIKVKLQELIYRKALKAFRHGKILQMKAFCQDIFNQPGNSPVAQQARQLLVKAKKQESLQQQLAAFSETLSKIDALLANEQVLAAQKLLENIQPKLPQQQLAWHKRQRQISQLQLQARLQNYRYYPAQQLKQIPIASTLKSTTKIDKLLLSNERTHAKVPTPGIFLVPVKKYVHCLNAISGKIRWSRLLDGEQIFWLFLNRDQVVGESDKADQVLLGSRQGQIVELIVVDSGRPIWQTQLPAPASSPPAWCGRMAIIACQNKYCYCLDGSSGVILGGFATKGIVGNPPVSDESSSVLFLADASNVYGFHTHSKKLNVYFPHATSEQPLGVLCGTGYICIITSGIGKIDIRFYFHEYGLHSQLEESHSLMVPGKILSKPVIQCGYLVVVSDQYWGKCFFRRLTNRQPPSLALFPNNGIRFANLLPDGEQMLTGGEDIRLYSSTQGKLLWQYQARNMRRIIPGSPCIPWQRVNDLYFISTSKGESYWATSIRIDSSRAKLQWRRRMGLTIASAPAVVDNDLMWLTTNGGSIMRLQLAPHNSVPRYQTLSGHPFANITTHLVALPTKRRLITVRSKGRSQKLHITKGAKVKGWKLRSSFSHLGAGVAQGLERMLFVADGSKLKLFSVRSGKQLCQWQPADGKQFSTAPVYFKGSIFIGNSNGNCYRLQLVRRKGHLAFRKSWAFFTAGSVFSKPYVTNASLYFGATDGKFYALSTAEGQQQWSYPARSAIYCSPLAVQQRIYFGTENGRLYALSLRSGKLLWQQQHSGAIRATPLYRHGRIYIVTTRGLIIALNWQTGDKIWQRQLPAQVDNIAFIIANRLYIGADDGFLYIVNLAHR